MMGQKLLAYTKIPVLSTDYVIKNSVNHPAGIAMDVWIYVLSHVCNGCSKQDSCTYERYYYIASYAHNVICTLS